MISNSCLRTVIVQVRNIERLGKPKEQLSYICRSLNAAQGISYLSKCNFVTTGRMMVDTGSAAKRGLIIDVLPEKEDDNGYISGGWKSDDGKLSCGYSSFRGKRASMEDFYDVKTSIINGEKVSMFGIFDGHGGSRAAEFLKEHLFENLMKHPLFMTNTKLAISETYQKTDMDFLESEKDTYRDDGSTASTAVLVGNHLYVANVGDSRTVISKAGKAIPFSEDHKPNRSDERKRIENAGGVVMWAGTWRVGGVLAMSRAFGNRMLKQFVVAEPEIQDQEMDDEFELLVLASDGLWDVVPNEDAMALARAEEEAEVAARKLAETAFSRGSADNITCIVVKFNHQKKKKAAEADPVSSRVDSDVARVGVVESANKVKADDPVGSRVASDGARVDAVESSTNKVKADDPVGARVASNVAPVDVVESSTNKVKADDPVGSRVASNVTPAIASPVVAPTDKK